ncbi:MAG: anhydro-N-acetylmuramic acid kinase [Rhodospirillales bacterium]|nr:anhydro-N-acetylmuramic acid kinase [Rhodospirillales bacterium]
MNKKIWCVVGLMSGTSLDGIDAAYVETDGEDRVTCGPAITLPYTPALRERLRRALGGRHPVKAVERDMTLAHAAAVDTLLSVHGIARTKLDLLGFHGQTIVHRPREGVTWQIGDGALLARRAGIDVVADFRRADVAAGGEGAPFVPVFHQAMARPLNRPIAVLNVGGVANVTWVGADHDILAFDTGPGNALIDDWTLAKTGQTLDENGALAAAGTVDEEAVVRLMAHAYFDRPPPKSLDRNAFDPTPVARLSAADGAATLTEFTAAAAASAAKHFPAPVTGWVVTGGGRRNPVLMAALARRLDGKAMGAEAVGWNGDALEAQAFGYLAVRSRLSLPLSFPTTTGVKQPTVGGRLFHPPNSG